MTMLTFPVMLTSQCCYNPLRKNFRHSNMSLLVHMIPQSLLMFDRRKVLSVLCSMFFIKLFAAVLVSGFIVK